MRILVTGGCGFIGSAVVRLAVGRGHDVINLDALTYAANLANVEPVAGSSRYVFAKVDIRDRSALDGVFARHQPDAVIHLAAESHVDRSIAGPMTFVDTNVVGTATLLEAARGFWVGRGAPSDFRFLHVSTDEVFGSLGPEGSFDETSPYDPRSPYAASKAASDHLVRAWSATYGLPTIVTNCSNNYGPFQFPEKLIPLCITRALQGRSIPVYGRGENVRDWLFVEDHAAALLLALEGGRVGRTYAVGGRGEARNIDLIRLICRLLDDAHPAGAPHATLVTFVEDRLGHDLRYSIDPSRIAEELDWRPSVSLEQGLRRTVAWYVENEAWWRPLLAHSSASPPPGRQPELGVASIP